jgi:hypothetical protein
MFIFPYLKGSIPVNRVVDRPARVFTVSKVSKLQRINECEGSFAKQLSDQNITEKTNLKGAPREPLAPDRRVQPMPAERKANPTLAFRYFPYSPGRHLASRGDQVPRSSELAVRADSKHVSTWCLYDRNWAFVGSTADRLSISHELWP